MATLDSPPVSPGPPESKKRRLSLKKDELLLDQTERSLKRLKPRISIDSTVSASLESCISRVDSQPSPRGPASPQERKQRETKKVIAKIIDEATEIASQVSDDEQSQQKDPTSSATSKVAADVSPPRPILGKNKLRRMQRRNSFVIHKKNRGSHAMLSGMIEAASCPNLTVARASPRSMDVPKSSWQNALFVPVPAHKELAASGSSNLLVQHLRQNWRKNNEKLAASSKTGSLPGPPS